MIVFWKWTIKSFQRNMAYRLEYFVSLLNALLYMFIFTSIWGAVFVEGQTKNGLTRELMINYAIFATLIKVTVVKTRDFIGQRVRTGEIAVDLLKPFSLPMMTLADAVGSWIFQIFSRGIPLIALAIYFFEISPPKGFDIEFLLSYVFSFFIFHGLLFMFGVASFYITDNFPLWLLNSSAVSLLSGSILPLQILPESVQKFAIFTPYPYLFYLPSMKLLRDDFPFEYALLRQVLVIVIIYFIGFVMYRYGKTRLHIQGG
ncbi:MAG: ABC-2 family transporter protein [Leptospirales bacterium]